MSLATLVPNAAAAGPPAMVSRQTGGAVGMGWLHSARFDTVFIAGIAALALLGGVAVALEPRLFVPLLLADLWLLGYHHVIATWTRLAFDRASVRHHGRLVFALPVAVLIATTALGFVGGLGAIATVYFYWQWFHYTRQSWGVTRAYGRKRDSASGPSPCAGPLFAAFFYGVPLWGLLRRVAEAPEQFLGMRFYTLPLPMAFADTVGALALGAGAVWLAGIWRGRRNLLAPAEAFFLLSHFTVFIIAYIVLRDVNHGWLVINIWHNAQYILFVWLYNRKRFEGGPVRDQGRFALSWLSQPGRITAYLAACVGLSTVVYLAISGALAGLAVGAVPATLVVFQTINFHHYIVDSVIWTRSRRAPPEAAG